MGYGHLVPQVAPEMLPINGRQLPRSYWVGLAVVLAALSAVIVALVVI